MSKPVIIFAKAHVDSYTRSDGTVVQAHDDSRQSASVKKPMPKSHTKLHADAAKGVAHSQPHAERHKELVDMYHSSNDDWERQAVNRLINKNWAYAEKAKK